MDISSLTIKLIVLIVPGIITAHIHKRLTITTKERSDFMFSVLAILLGMMCYLILQVSYFLIIGIINKISLAEYEYKTLDTFSKISDSTIIPYNEVLLACLISLPFGLLITYLDSKKVLNKIANKLNVSNKYGHENLFTFFLNSPDIEWVYIRDTNKGLTYLGNIRMLSETENLKEVVLENVTVYTYPDSEELYSIHRIYLSLDLNSIIIEQANIVTNGREKK